MYIVNVRFTVRIGKNGITGGVIAEIRRQLEKYKIVKVKFLRCAIIDKNDFKEQVNHLLSIVTEATLVEIRGRTVILTFRDK